MNESVFVFTSVKLKINNSEEGVQKLMNEWYVLKECAQCNWHTAFYSTVFLEAYLETFLTFCRGAVVQYSMCTE